MQNSLNKTFSAGIAMAVMTTLAACGDQDSNSSASSQATTVAAAAAGSSSGTATTAQTGTGKTSGSTTTTPSTSASTSSNNGSTGSSSTTANGTSAASGMTAAELSALSNAVVSADTNRPNNSTFIPGEDIQVKIHVSSMSASARTTLAVTVRDAFGNPVDATTLPISADGNGAAEAVYTASSDKMGYFRVEASLPNGASVGALGTRPAGFVTYAVVTNPAGRVNYGDAGSRFGMQGGFSYGQGNVMADLGIRYLIDSSGWTTLEPHYSGEFTDQRNAALAKGQQFPFHMASNTAAWATYAMPVISTASVPTWAMQPGSGTQKAPNMGILNGAGTSGLSAFAQARAAEFASYYSRQSSHYYQVTWEPEMPVLFGGTPQQLVQYYQTSYQALHQADSKAIVMGPTMFPGDEKPLQKLLDAGLANYVDAISMHPYVKFPPESHGLVSSIHTQMQEVATAKGRSVSWVSTEHGYESAKVGELNEALGNIRESIILLGEGFKFDINFYMADFWTTSPTDNTGTYGYYWNLNPNIKFGTDKIGPKPTAPAFAALTSMIDGTTSAGVVSQVTGTQMGYRFHRGNTTILALWDSAASTTVSLPVNGTVNVCDWMGNCTAMTASNGVLQLTLGSAPVYVQGGQDL